jgi:DNA polymerase
MLRTALISALQWHLNNGADDALENEPRRISVIHEKDDSVKIVASVPAAPMTTPAVASLAGAPTLRVEAIKLAAAAQTLDELREVIATFNGLDIKGTATNTVFCDGNRRAPVMLIGEAPGADEDRIGRPFVGVSGQLLDRILKCIALDREQDDPTKSIYISNILNWRPPGNRTPTPAEVEVSLPFIERHIALAKPKLLILAGGVSAKALLGTEESISRLRGRWHSYIPRTEGIGDGAPIPALATYHPSYLLRTPSQKKAVWQDMLILQDKMREMELS